MVLLCPGLAVLINLVAANRQCQFSCWHVLLVGASHIPVLCNLFPASELVPTILNGSRQPVNPAICVALPPLECINFCHLCFVGGRLYCLKTNIDEVSWWKMKTNLTWAYFALFCISLIWMAGSWTSNGAFRFSHHPRLLFYFRPVLLREQVHQGVPMGDPDQAGWTRARWR